MKSFLITTVFLLQATLASAQSFYPAPDYREYGSPGSATEGDQRRVSLNFVLIRHAGQWRIAQQVISDIRPRRTPGQSLPTKEK